MNSRTIRIGLAAPLAAAALVLAPGTMALAASPSPSASASPSPSPSPVGPWRPQTTPVEEHLHGIFAFDGCHAWAVGEEAGDGKVAGAQSSLIATADGGKTWKNQTFPPGSALRTTMNRVFFTDVNSGYAAGEGSNRSQQQQAGSRPRFPAATPSPSPSPIVPTGPNFIVTTNGGATWVDLSANLPAETKGTSGNQDIEGLTAIGDKVWIAEDNNNVGIIAYSANRGATWTVQKNVADDTFSSISMYDANNGFATSDGRNLWRTTNGGAAWNQVAQPAVIAEGVWATGPSSAVIVEGSGKIAYTSDGSTLFPATLPQGVTGDILDVAFGTASDGLASGELDGSLLETSDGGKNWTLQTANAGNNNFNGVTMAKGTTVSFVTGESGVVAGNTDPAVGCVAAAQLPANTSATPKLPAAGFGTNFEGPLWIGFVLMVLMGLGVGGRAVAQGIRSRV